MASDGGEPNGFKQFDVVSDPSDHHFNVVSKSGGGVCFGNEVHRKIMREWKILEKHLPDSIYVRVYETRVDLLRAVIIGAAGTPYHDALFLFDIAFPSDYPTRPPQVYYHSFGNRVNPNLYHSGFVCLSLLNTWHGKKQEKWDPSQSTILQVLVSIQGLVLNERPYFNEPGMGTGPGAHIRWAKVAREYDEDKFVSTHKTTHQLLRRPPKNFEALVADHFRQRASAILRACVAYASGRVAVGDYKEGHANGAGSVRKVRTKFRKSVELLYPQLFEGFRSNGACLEGLAENLKVEVPRTPPSVQKEGNESSVVGWVFGKLKNILGCGSQNRKKVTSKKKAGCGSKRNTGGAATAD